VQLVLARVGIAEVEIYASVAISGIPVERLLESIGVKIGSSCMSTAFAVLPDIIAFALLIDTGRGYGVAPS
jgi:hypothetical protein